MQWSISLQINCKLRDETTITPLIGSVTVTLRMKLYIIYLIPSTVDFETYRLNGVRLTEEEFGRGSYAVVLRLEYRGLKCAGKQLYTVLYEQGVGDIVRRFEEECRLLAQMRHPNIVQFIGVYFEEGSRVPILVMEFLPTTLAKCIDTYGVLPEEVSYSILHDVALGLYHLHSQTPPIVHRDLSANNVLLATNMTAKISDLGVARILNLTPQQMCHMTGAPGTPAYMPPEAMRANPMYNARIDEFSYGVLMIHVLCGQWPMPREPVRVNPQNRAELLPVSEAERRQEYLRDIGNAHPLMDLILRCVSNDPEQRATAAQMVQRMQYMTRHSPPAFPNRVEMLQRIRGDATEKGSLREENEQSRREREELIQHHRAEVEQVHTAIQRLTQLAQHCQEDFQRSELAHSIEITETRLQLQVALQTELRAQTETHQAETRAQNETHQAEMRAQIKTHQTQMRTQKEIHQTEMRTQNETHQDEVEQVRTEMKTQNETHQAEIRAKNETHQAEMRAQNETHQAEMRAQNETHQAEMRAQNETHQTETRTQNETHQTEMMAQNEARKQERKSLAHELDSLRSEVSKLRDANKNLQTTVASKNEILQSYAREISSKKHALTSKDATLTQKESELASKNAILEHQSSTIQEQNGQLTRAREFLSGQKPQV